MIKLWDGKRLAALEERTGLSRTQLSLATGICITTLNAYMSNKARPGLDSLVTLADFFAVPVDYLLGRCTEEQAQAVLGNYAEHFMTLRRAPYEAYLDAGRRPLRMTRYSEYEAPWPYNLASAICGEPIDWIMGEDNIAALEHALSVLNDRERLAVLLYYQHCKSLEDVGREFNVTRERIRQIIMRAVKKMQHPSTVRALHEGLHMSAKQDEAEAHLQYLEEQIDCLERKLAERKAALHEACVEKGAVPEANTDLSTPVIDLGMSVRSTNCLWRAGYDTLEKVITAAEAGKLKGVRNLGRKSLTEILAMLMEMTGKDYRAVNA